MNWTDYIEVRPDVALGKPIFKGTRLTVEFVLERLGDGATVDDLVNNYVGLTPNHVRDATAYAAAVLRRDELTNSEQDWNSPSDVTLLLLMSPFCSQDCQCLQAPAPLGPSFAALFAFDFGRACLDPSHDVGWYRNGA